MNSDRGFIFTMDAVLSLVPIFIIIGSVSTISDAQSLYTQSYILGSERIVQDVLESMRIHGDFDNLGRQDINGTVSSLLPDDYEFDYTVTYNGTQITNFSTGTPPDLVDIIVGKRTSFINLEKVLDLSVAISHGGSPATSEYCDCNSSNKVWKLEFAYAPDDYDYYLLFERDTTSTGGFWRINDTGISTSQCESNPEKLCTMNAGNGQKIYTGNELTSRELLTSGNVYNDATMNPNQKYYVYIRVVANPGAFFDAYVIRTKLGADPNDITSENAQKYENADVTLKVWRE